MIRTSNIFSSAECIFRARIKSDKGTKYYSSITTYIYLNVFGDGTRVNLYLGMSHQGTSAFCDDGDERNNK